MSDTTIPETTGRPMPDCVKRGLIAVQDGKTYLKAPFRVMWMRLEHPDWQIHTAIEYADYEKGFVVFRASIIDEKGTVLATAHSEESRGRLPYVKKAETGAIARVLGLCGYGTEFGEFDEEDIADSPRQTPARNAETGKFTGGNNNRVPNNSGSQCPVCHAPDGAKHLANCAEAKQKAA